MSCQLRDFTADESCRAGFKWLLFLTVFFVVFELFSLKAAIYFSVYVRIQTGASSSAELLSVAFSCFALVIFLPSFDFVASNRTQTFSLSCLAR